MNWSDMILPPHPLDSRTCQQIWFSGTCEPPTTGLNGNGMAVVVVTASVAIFSSTSSETTSASIPKIFSSASIWKWDVAAANDVDDSELTMACTVRLILAALKACVAGLWRANWKGSISLLPVMPQLERAKSIQRIVKRKSCCTVAIRWTD